MTKLIIPLNVSGLGGVGGGQGSQGQGSEINQGFSARSYGIPVIMTTTGITADFEVQLTKDIQGTVPVLFLSSSSVYIDSIKLVCINSLNPSDNIFLKLCQILDNGIVKFKLLALDINYHQGMHFALFQCYKDSVLIKIFKCFIEIRKGLTGANRNLSTPLTIGLVRMLAYDTCAEKNVLLDDLLFSDMQIAYCIQKALDDWNEMPPALLTGMTVGNFPYRSHLCTGALYYLFKMASYRYLRNSIRHSNGGLVFDDQDKGQIYQGLSQAVGALWNSFITVKKTELNMLLCMGSYSNGFMDSNYNPWWY